MEIVSKVILLTPEVASALLANNKINRPVTQHRVDSYAETIRRGEWALNGETICVSKDGMLLQGQHRCLAVVQCGIAIKTLLVENVDEAAFATYDQGKPRSTADVLAIKGIKHPTYMAGALGLLNKFLKSGTPYNGNPRLRLTKTEELALLEANSGLVYSVTYVKTLKWLTKHVSPSMLAFCHYIFHKHNEVAANDFFEKLECGAGLCTTSPILMLRNRISTSTTRTVSTTNHYVCMLFFKAFKLFISNTPTHVLRVRLEGDVPEKGVFLL